MTNEIRDILLLLLSYPDRSPGSAIEAALKLADHFDARISSIVSQTCIPEVGNWLAEKLVHANEVIAFENARSSAAATELLTEFAKVVPVGRRGGQILVECGPMTFPTEPARLARTHDFTFLPVTTGVEFQLAAESLIFESGRPVILLPEIVSDFLDIAIAWDGSRAAARSLAAAIPFCRKARSVRVIAISGDKDFDTYLALEEAVRHLACHDIATKIEVVEITDRDVGATLMNHAVKTAADLLVMGGYGHSKAREFVLGGATRTVIKSPQLPVLLTH